MINKISRVETPLVGVSGRRDGRQPAQMLRLAGRGPSLRDCIGFCVVKICRDCAPALSA